MGICLGVESLKYAIGGYVYKFISLILAMPKIAVIAEFDVDGFLDRPEEIRVPGRYKTGEHSGSGNVRMLQGSVSGRDVVCVRRSDVGYNGCKPIRPRDFDYKLLMTALENYGTTHVLSTAPIKSGDDGMEKGDIVIPANYIDFTDMDVSMDGSGLDEGCVDMKYPYPFSLKETIRKASGLFDGDGRIKVPERSDKEVLVFGDGLYVVLKTGRVSETSPEATFLRHSLSNQEMRLLIGGGEFVAEAILSGALGMGLGCIGYVVDYFADIENDPAGSETISKQQATRIAEPKLKEVLTKTIELIE